MMKRTILNRVSAMVGLAMALGLVVFFFVYRPAQTNRIQHLATPPSNRPGATTEIKASEVSSLTLETDYKEFFEANSKCRKSYDEVYGKGGGFSSESSPCRAEIVFNRDGSAVKSIELRRYDTATRGLRVVEKAVWKSRMTSAQFNALAGAIVDSDVFKGWQDGTQIYRRNTTITVRQIDGVRQLMSYVDQTTTAFLPLVEAFKKLDSQLSWQKVE